MTTYSLTEVKDDLFQLVHSNQVVEIQNHEKDTSVILLSKTKWEATNSLLEEMERQLAIKEIAEAKAKSGGEMYTAEEAAKMLKEAGFGRLD